MTAAASIVSSASRSTVRSGTGGSSTRSRSTSPRTSWPTTHTGPWGLVPATGRPVAFDEIVIMTVRDSKVVHQTGVIDNVTDLRQVGVLPAART
jgi:SnoaL-like polyketide cyclase